MKSIFIHPIFEEIYSRHPIILIDVGASGGIPCIWRRAKKALRVVGFEPDLRAFDSFRNETNVPQKFINTALYSSDGIVALRLTKKQECSSIFMPNLSFLRQFPDAKRYEVINSINIKVERLSKELLANEGIHDADFLKVDTQGGDLYVLKGAAELLDSFLFGINVEVEFALVYKDQPLFSDVDIFLREHGFQIFDLRRYYWKRNVAMDTRNAKGQLVFADALYFKTYESFTNGIHNMDRACQKAKILKAISICLIYNKIDYALYLCERAAEDNILSLNDKEVIFKELYRKRKGIKFRGQYTLAKFLHSLYLYLKSGEFYFTDEELGDE